jgi:hypothetical protein
MALLKNIFGPDYERWEGVPKINIYLLRLLFILMLVFLGKDSWTYILTFKGVWSPMNAMAWCIWASYSVLSILGIIHPLKMLPIVMLEILYKVIWLILVAYPLWSTNQLAGSPAEGMTYVFLLVILPILAMPWRYFFKKYILIEKRG